MSAAALVAVAFGDAPPVAACAALGVTEVVLAADFTTPRALLGACDASSRTVLWLPAWARVSTALVTAVSEWRARAVDDRARVALVRPRLLCGDGGSLTTPACVLLSSPGAAVLDGEQVRPLPGSATEDLAVPLDVVLPDDLTRHLEGVNAQTSVAARLRHAAGRRATWSDLVWTPAWHGLRTLARADGSRRELLPRAVIEAYREVLVTAKLWELAHGPSVA